MFDLDHHPKTLVHMEIFGSPTLPRGLKPELIQVDWTCWYWRKEA